MTRNRCQCLSLCASSEGSKTCPRTISSRPTVNKYSTLSYVRTDKMSTLFYQKAFQNGRKCQYFKKFVQLLCYYFLASLKRFFHGHRDLVSSSGFKSFNSQCFKRNIFKCTIFILGWRQTNIKTKQQKYYSLVWFGDVKQQRLTWRVHQFLKCLYTSKLNPRRQKI